MLPTTSQWRRARRLSPIVRERRRFLVNELIGRRGVHEYRLRAHDSIAVVRHNQYDAGVLHEVFRDPFYTPPPPVEAVLLRRERPLEILDLGGNIGCFSLLMLKRYPDARVTAFEPDPDNAALQRRCMERNGVEDRWSLVEACAGAEDGATPFIGGQAALSRMPLPGDGSGDAPTMTVPVVDVLPRLAGIDLLKIDIEGGEWALLYDPRFEESPPAAMLMEWHSHDCPEDNARRAAASRLEDMGYTVLHEKPPRVPDSEPMYGAGALWAWQGED
jgi:FkbM family methyltransferase